MVTCRCCVAWWRGTDVLIHSPHSSLGSCFPFRSLFRLMLSAAIPKPFLLLEHNLAECQCRSVQYKHSFVKRSRIDILVPYEHTKSDHICEWWRHKPRINVSFTKQTVFLKNAVFWNVAPRRSCVNRRFGGTYRLHFQGRKIRERGTSVSRWLHCGRL
jgi:hypothetical protein